MSITIPDPCPTGTVFVPAGTALLFTPGTDTSLATQPVKTLAGGAQ